MTYSASGLPGGLSIDGTTGLIAGTIDYWAAVGSPYTVIVTATDPGGLTGNATFTWNVANTNQTPVVTNPGAQTSAEGAVISLQIGANDPDLESLTYSASGLPGGLSIDGTTGLIAGTIDYWAAVGSPYTVIVTATDPGGLTGNATFTWNVANTNQTPVVTNPGAQTSAEGAVISLQIGANDPDLESLTYSASGLPGGLSIDGTTGYRGDDRLLGGGRQSVHGDRDGDGSGWADGECDVHVERCEHEPDAGGDESGGADECGRGGDLAANRGERSGP